MTAVNLQVAEKYVAAFEALAKEGNTLIVPGNMGDMGIMMLYGTVMLGLCIAGIVLLITKRKSWEFYLAPEELPAGLKIRTAYANPGVIAYLLLTVMLTGWMLFA